MMLLPPPRTARIVITAAVENDVTVDDVVRDLENELGSSVYLSVRTQFVEILEPYVPSARMTWRGSEASARALGDYVNLIDSASHRAGNQYARAEAHIERVEVGYGGSEPLRTDYHARCVVDAFDGVHDLSDGDTLVAIDDGWTVQKADRS